MGIFKPAWMSENESKALKAVSKLMDEATLAIVWKEARNRTVREAAVEKLTDQEVLAEVAKKDGNLYILAISKLTDNKLLADIIKSVSSHEVIEEAFEKLASLHFQSDIDILSTDIAVNATDAWARIKAIQMLTDHRVLANIAKSGETGLEKEKAVGRLIDRVLLADIAENDESESVREIALIRFKRISESDTDSEKCMTPEKKTNRADPVSLYFVKKDRYMWKYNVDECISAIYQLTDQFFLFDIKMDGDLDKPVREAAEKTYLSVHRTAKVKIDEAIIVSVMQKLGDADYRVRRGAARDPQLNSQIILARIAMGGDHFEVKHAAAGNINLTDPTLLAHIVTNVSADDAVRTQALWKLTDISTITDVAMNTPASVLRDQARQRLIDQDLLEDIVSNAENIEQRLYAIANLLKLDVLANIASNDENEQIRKAAKRQMDSLS